MVRFTIDQELVEKLLSTNEMVELCDESGRLVRRILPELNPSQNDPSFGRGKQLPSDMSPEEYQRLRDSDNWDGMSTSEAIDYLRNQP